MTWRDENRLIWTLSVVCVMTAWTGLTFIDFSSDCERRVGGHCFHCQGFIQVGATFNGNQDLEMYTLRLFELYNLIKTAEAS